MPLNPGDIVTEFNSHTRQTKTLTVLELLPGNRIKVGYLFAPWQESTSWISLPERLTKLT